MTRPSPIVILALGLILFLIACTAQTTISPTLTPAPTKIPTLAADPTAQPTTAPLTFTDGLNRTVSLPNPAQRVISLAPSNTEILFAIGAGTQVVGRDEFSNFPPEALDLPSIGGSFGDYNLEAIVDLQPDLVLAAEINPPELVDSLDSLGVTVFLLPNPTDLTGMLANLQTVGRLTGQEASANDLVAVLDHRVAFIQDKVAAAEQFPTVFYEVDSSDPNAPWTTGPNTFIDTLISMAGGQNIGAVLDSQYAQISIETLVAQDPQIILLGDAIWGVTPEDVSQRPGWDSISAVQQARVHPFNDDLVSRPGPRLVDGLEALTALLHPELFE